MREIKFQAWDKEKKQMISPNDGDFIAWGAPSNWKQFYELMQYTGLKDKNGKEIYEGDVIKGVHRSDEEWVLKHRVTFLKGCFMFGNWNAHEYFNKHTHIEVIGNIYDNPELKEDTP